MVDTRTFLLQIAEENKIDPQRVEPVIQKLLDEWYETAASLQEITESQYASLGVPARLVELIKKKNLENKLSPTEALPLLVNELLEIDAATLRVCIETLRVLLGNLLKFSEEKYRKVKISNPGFHSKVGKYPKAVEYLQAVGFEVKGEFLELIREVPDLIASAIGELDEILANTLASDFNPYEVRVTSINTSTFKAPQGENDPLKIKKEIERLNSQSFPSVQRQAKIYEMNSNVPESLKKFQVDPALENTDEISQLANIQSVMRQREELSNFRNKKKGELNRIQETQVVSVVVKIKFPDKKILEGNFSVRETAADLYSFVAGNLQQVGREFYLYETPPKKVIKNGNHGLKPFAPATSLYFSWSDLTQTTEANGPFLRI